MADPSYGIAPSVIYEVVLESVRPIRGLRILDLPCASGGFARQLASEGALCLAADLVPAMTYRPAVVINMNRVLPFDDGVFDVITCLEGIEHMHDPFLLVGEFHRVLRPGGRLVLSTPNIHNLRSRVKFLLRGTLFWFDPREVTGVGHVTVLPYFILRHILASSGFEQVQVRASRTVQPAFPNFVTRAMQLLFSLPNESDRELNSSLFLNSESLVVFANKPQPTGESRC